MNKTLLGIALLFALLAPSANAGLLRFDFSGTILAPFPDDGTSANGTFSGSILLDSSVSDIRPQANNAQYDHAVIDANLELNGTNFNFTPGPFDDLFVLNDSATFNDLFAIFATFVAMDGTSMVAAFQLADSSQSAFSSDGFPSMLDYADFDDFVVGNANGSGAFFLFGGDDLQGSIDFAQLYAIPEPGSWPLLLIGCASFLFAARRRELAAAPSGAAK